MRVKVTFYYDPDEADEADSTGMSEPEYDRLMEKLMQIGADNIEIEKEES